jgi:hypothetical protein
VVEKVIPDLQDALLKQVESIYQNLEKELASEASLCRACGRCCDFESFGHRLYLTTPELFYFAHHVAHPLKPMPSGICPYRIGGQCSVYPYRFAGCRIFQCKGNPALQSDHSEAVIAQFKHLCDHLRLPYRYCDLKTALNS